MQLKREIKSLVKKISCLIYLSVVGLGAVFAVFGIFNRGDPAGAYFIFGGLLLASSSIIYLLRWNCKESLSEN